MGTCPTVRIKSDNEQGFVVINASAFDKTKHALFSPPPEPVVKEVAPEPPKRKVAK